MFVVIPSDGLRPATYEKNFTIKENKVPALTKAVWRRISRRGRVRQAKGSAKLPPKGIPSFLVICPSPYGLG